MPENKRIPKRLGEVKEKRSPNAKHFLNDDGSYTAEISSGILHFEGENNQYHDMQVEIYDEDDFPDLEIQVYKGKANSFKARKEIQKGLREKYKGKKVQSTETDFHALTVPFDLTIPKQFKKGYSIGKGSDRLTFKPVDAANALGSKVGANRIKYDDVWTAADVTLDLTDRGIKETIILKGEAAPTIFSFEVIGPLKDDLTAGSLRLDPAWLVDANGEKRDVQQQIRRQGARTFVDLVADVYGLAYPVEIDPTVTLQPDAAAGKDAYIKEQSPDINGGNNSNLLVGCNTNTPEHYRSVIQFDFSTNPLPEGSTIENAFLSMYYWGNFDSYSGNWNMGLYELLGSWDETTVTWNNLPSISTTQAAKTPIEMSVYKFYNWDVKTLINKYLSGQSVNYGWLIKPEYSIGLGAYFYSSDYTNNTTLRPKLLINYNEPPTTPTLISPNGSEIWNEVHEISWTAASDPAHVVTISNEEKDTYVTEANIERAQTFKADFSGVLESVEFVSSSNNTYNVSIYETDGTLPTNKITNDVLSEFVETTSSGYHRYKATFNKQLTIGMTYAFVITFSSKWYIKADGSNPYPSGKTYYKNTSGSWVVQEADLVGSLKFAAGGDHLKYQVQLSTDNGSNWKDIISLTAASVTSQSYNFVNEPESTQSKVRVRAFDGKAYGGWDESDSVFTIKHNSTPTAPTGLNPGGESASPEIVTTLTPRLNWTFNDPDGDDTQSAYQLRIYNSGGSLVHDSGKVSSSNKFYDVPSAALSWGSTFYWRVSTWDVNGPEQSPYSSDVWIKTNQGPTANLTDPSGTSAPGTVYHDTVQPTFSWTYSDPEGYAQAAIQIKIVDGSTSVWDSGEVATTGTSYQVPGTANLIYDKNYTAQIRAKDNEGTWGSYSAAKYFHLNRSPNSPGNFKPSGTEASPEVINDNLQPRISWEFNDSDNTDSQTAYQVQILDTSAAIVHDSGQIGSNNQFYDIPFGTLLMGKKYHYQVITKDQHGKWGSWSSSQYFYTNASPDTPLDPNPAGASSSSPAILYDDLTPVFFWTFEDANTGDSQAAFQFRLYNELGTIIHDTGEVSGSNQSYEIPNAYKLIYGEFYQWDVRTKDNYGAWSNYTSKGWIKIQIGSPTGVIANPDNYAAKILLDWNDHSAEDLSGYDVYRSTAAGGPYTKINDVLLTQSNYQDSQIITDQTYYYVIQAIVTGQEPSPYSSEVSAKAIFAAWYIGDFKFEGPTKMIKKRSRAQSKRVVLGKSKQVVQDRGFLGEELQLEIFLTDDSYSSGQIKYDQLMSELSKVEALNVRDPFGRVWKVAPGMFEDEQLITGKLEYKVKFDLTEVN